MKDKLYNMITSLAKSLGFEVKKGSGLYVRRRLCNVSEIVLRNWASAVGLPNINWGNLHVTLVHSAKVVPITLDPKSMDVPLTNPRLEVLNGGVIALCFDCDAITARHQEIMDAGAEFSYNEFKPHVTLSLSSWDYLGVEFDCSKVEFKQLPGLITLEGEEAMPAEDEDEAEAEKRLNAATEEANKNKSPVTITSVVISKTEDDQQVVWGWASVVEENGEEVTDHQGDVISAEDMQKAAWDFVKTVRAGKVMHEGDYKTELVDSVFMSNDLQKALGINLKKVGWLVGFHVPCKETWEKVKSGKLPAFSIGGRGERTPIEE